MLSLSLPALCDLLCITGNTVAGLSVKPQAHTHFLSSKSQQAAMKLDVEYFSSSFFRDCYNVSVTLTIKPVLFCSFFVVVVCLFCLLCIVSIIIKKSSKCNCRETVGWWSDML